VGIGDLLRLSSSTGEGENVTMADRMSHVKENS